MRMYVIYWRPIDYPDSYVVRGWTIGPGTMRSDEQPTAVTESLKKARGHIPAGMQITLPSKDDDPVIVEVWI